MLCQLPIPAISFNNNINSFVPLFFFKGPTFCCQGCHVLAIVVVVVLVAGNIIIVQLNFSTENRLLFYRTASVDAKNRIKPDQPSPALKKIAVQPSCTKRSAHCHCHSHFSFRISLEQFLFFFLFTWALRFLIAISPDSRLHDLLRTLSAALNWRTKGNWCRRAWKMHFPKR